MKLINPTAEALRSSEKRVHELEIEKQRLEQEIAQLRSASRRSTLSQATTQRVQTSSRLVPNHARPTASSLAKCPTVKTSQKAATSLKPVYIIGNHTKYSYEDGVPIAVAHFETEDQIWKPVDKNYMKKTQASDSRKWAIYWEQHELARRAKSHALPSPLSPSSTTPLHGDSWSNWGDVIRSKRQNSDPTARSKDVDCNREIVVESYDVCDSCYDVPNLDVISRLEEGWRDNKTLLCLSYEKIRIDSAIGLQILRRTMTLVQETIYPLFQKNWGGISGPHLVLLGRNELIRIIGENTWNSPWLEINGHCRVSVQGALLRMPLLRNAIAHPNAWQLCQPGELDDRLQDAQKVAFMFRDFERTMEIRNLRDQLVPEAQRSDERLASLCALATMPFCGSMEFEPHLYDVLESRHDSARGEAETDCVVWQAATALGVRDNRRRRYRRNETSGHWEVEAE
ncbi:hypothetical protein F5Y18DRAFT_436905 [Xylariaceae sp. FL1019]|nr:hypothetical protein F5Y18DRAFT_436905 [Xylariaceae sp. FL1019]